MLTLRQKRKYKKFIFQKYKLDKSKNQIRFYYSLDDKINFVDVLRLDLQSIDWKKINNKLLDNILFNLHLIIGISYWKTYCAPEFIIKTGVLNKKQADFWNKIYAKGLGEFYYKNKIDFRNLINFPYKNIKNKPIKFNLKNRSLVPFGGGKDSIVTAELLKKADYDFTLINLRDSKIQKDTAKIVNKERIVIDRIMDKKLLKLNKLGCYNGHVPMSAIFSFTALLAGILHNYKYIIFSNEQSANFGNIKYLGQKINHQYSKSLEFEKDFSSYIHKFITPSIDYFSLLRPFFELKIAELFSKHKKYFPAFSSCNKNFIINKKMKKQWCGRCAKCAFVFSQLSAFISKKELIKIFKKNLYADKSLLNIYKELLGVKNIKPFDCVGTSNEVKAAMYLALQKKEFDNDFILKYFNNKILPKIKAPKKLVGNILLTRGRHNIHKNFQNIINKPR